MDGWETTKVFAGIGAAAAVLGFGFWFGNQVVPSAFPGEPGFAVAGVPPVDLAAMQRSWPGGLRPGDADKLYGYIARIDQAVVPDPTEGAPGAAEPPPDLGTLLAAADLERGRRTAMSCGSCHTFEPGGPNRVGPNLHGIAGRPVAGHPGYVYSDALAAEDGRWTWEALDAYLTSPARAVPGTKMAFAGIRNPRERAHLLAYLGSVSPSPPPLPQPGPPPAETPPTAGPVSTR